MFFRQFLLFPEVGALFLHILHIARAFFWAFEIVGIGVSSEFDGSRETAMSQKSDCPVVSRTNLAQMFRLHFHAIGGQVQLVVGFTLFRAQHEC